MTKFRFEISADADTTAAELLCAAAFFGAWAALIDEACADDPDDAVHHTPDLAEVETVQRDPSPEPAKRGRGRPRKEKGAEAPIEEAPAAEGAEDGATLYALTEDGAQTVADESAAIDAPRSVTGEDCRAALAAINAVFGYDEARKLILPFAQKMSGLTEDQFGAFFAACEDYATSHQDGLDEAQTALLKSAF